MGFCSTALILAWCPAALVTPRPRSLQQQKSFGFLQPETTLAACCSPVPCSSFLILFGLPRDPKTMRISLSETFPQCSRATSTVKLKRLFFPSLVIRLGESQVHLYLHPPGDTRSYSTQSHEPLSRNPACTAGTCRQT